MLPSPSSYGTSPFPKGVLAQNSVWIPSLPILSISLANRNVRHCSPYVIPTIYSYLSLPKSGDFRLMPTGVWSRVVFSVVATISEEYVALIFRFGFRNCVTVLLLLVNRQRISSNLKRGKLIAVFPVNHTVQRHFLASKFTLCLFRNFYYRKIWRRDSRSMAGTRNLKNDGWRIQKWRDWNVLTLTELANEEKLIKWK
jgi:hypothetical protein